MATESFGKVFTIDPDWCIKNLIEAIVRGSPIIKEFTTPEAKAEFARATTMTPEKAARLKAKYGK